MNAGEASSYGGSRNGGILLALFFTNVVLRFGVLFLEQGSFRLDALPYPDEHHYLESARDLLNHGLPWLCSEKSLESPPGQVLFLAITGGRVPLAKLLDIFASAITLLPVVAIARRLMPAGGVLAAAIAFTLCIPVLRVAPTLLTEPMNTFLLTAGIAVLVNTDFGDSGRRSAGRRCFIAGLLIGLATLFRMTTLLLPLGLAMLLATAWIVPRVRARLAFSIPSALRGCAIAFLGVGMVVAPLTIKNGLASGAWELNTGFGATLYVGADPKTNGHEPFFADYDYDTTEVTAPYNHLQKAGDEMLARAAVREIRRDPLGFAGRRVAWPLRLLIGQPADLFWPAQSIQDSAPRRGNVETVLTVLNLLWRVLAIFFAIAYLLRGWPEFRGFVLLGLLLYFLVAFLPFFVIPRYSIPLLPAMTAPAIAFFTQQPKPARWFTWSMIALCTTAVLALAFWRAAFPRTVDPNDYSHHSLIAQWPTKKEGWKTLVGEEQGHGADDSKTLVVSNEAIVEAEGAAVRLEHNQVFLFPLRARTLLPSEEVQLFWATQSLPAFSEERSLRARIKLGSSNTLHFAIPASAGDSLTAIRLDAGNLPGALVELNDAKLLYSTESSDHELSLSRNWFCEHHCSNVVEKNGSVSFVATGEDPSLAHRFPALSMGRQTNFGARLTVTETAHSSTRRKEESWIYGSLLWLKDGDRGWDERQRLDFFLTADRGWSWLQLNPSRFAEARWTGELRAVRLRLRSRHGSVVEIGPLRLLKDFRMVQKISAGSR